MERYIELILGAVVHYTPHISYRKHKKRPKTGKVLTNLRKYFEGPASATRASSFSKVFKRKEKLLQKDEFSSNEMHCK